MENFENEIWKDIPNYEGIYQASNLGRVKSLERIDALGHRLKERILKPQINHRGYYQVVLYKNSKIKTYRINRLVWIAFNGQIPENMQVNHINEIKSDNRLSNLNLMTPKENTNYGTGIERCHNQQINGKCSKPVLQFTLEDILINEYPSTKQVERELGFDQGHICDCCNGKQKTAYGYKWKYAKEVD